jgi:hypothetical protein
MVFNLFKGKKEKQSFLNTQHNLMYEEQFEFRENLQKEYEYIINNHFNLMNEIQQVYSIAINQPSIKNKYTEKCKELCKKDISLSKDYIEYLKKIHFSYGYKDEPFIGTYPSFSTLAKIYEKEKEYQKGILVCINALRIGYKLDTSKGGLQGRLARLIKKYNQQSGDNVSYDYDTNILLNKNGKQIEI